MRISEAVELDVGDVPFTERKGIVRVRLGKGEKPRDIPLPGPSSALRALAAWRAHRRDQLGMPDDAGPLFVTRGERLAERSIRDVVTSHNDVNSTVVYTGPRADHLASAIDGVIRRLREPSPG
ncbi:tyrosine-type recombinase/integrase [Nocardioides panzhihuensis]|uniref:Site-specific recombinase XerC n=1 Tax=Nocardioides panzhihuensis TaxID=860243 RepID=A0A7Z0IUH8_9ACTN|nr:tyrosine-type recombinase/integrase [Nocardioides panzhihuensis]NYI79985.1 site-specific recombinase XerC [Nocardioides panzhihuensis]